MEKRNNIKKEKHISFFNFIKKEDLDDSSFVDWMGELQKDLTNFWEKINN